MPQLEVLNRVAGPVRRSIAAAPQRTDRSGATIGRYGSRKAGGDEAPDRAEALPRAFHGVGGPAEESA